jgi:hypothetical protein
VTYEVARIPSVLDIVGGSSSVSIIPALALALPTVEETFHHRAICNPEISRQIDLIVSRQHTMRPAVPAFKSMLLEHPANLPRTPHPGVTIRVGRGQ